MIKWKAEEILKLKCGDSSKKDNDQNALKRKQKNKEISAPIIPRLFTTATHFWRNGWGNPCFIFAIFLCKCKVVAILQTCYYD